MVSRHTRLGIGRLASVSLISLVVVAALVAAFSAWGRAGTPTTEAVDGPSITVTKTVTLSPGGPFVGEFTFTFTVHNDGGTPLRIIDAKDSHLGNITWAFIDQGFQTLDIGQTAVVILTKPQLPGDPLCDFLTVSYGFFQPGSVEVAKDTAEACVEVPETGSVTLTKFKEVGLSTKPIEVCFRLDIKTNGYVPSPDALPAAEQCKAPDASGNATFTWTNLPLGEYQMVETKEVCEVNGVLEDPCTAYGPLPPKVVASFSITDANLNVILPLVENPLLPGEICFEKRNPDGSLWSGGQGDVKFIVDSLSDPGFPEQTHFVPTEGNPFCKVVPEGTYEICETPPPNHTVSPSVCQTVDALAAQPATVTVTFVNTPADGEGCTPGFWRNARNGRTFWDEASDAIPIAIGAALDIDPAVVAAIDPASDFYAVFMVDPDTAGLDVPFTTDDAIRDGGGNPHKLARHGMAALLNAAGVNYPLGIVEVKDAVKAALESGNYEPLATELNDFNNLSPDCPVND